MRTCLIGVALLVLASFVVTEARGQELTGDLEKLQGKWAANLQIGNRKQLIIIEFKGNSVFTTMGKSPDGEPDTEQEVKINESATPKTMDLVKGKNLKAKPGSIEEKIGVPDIMGIYELDGDTLKMASMPLSNKRPASFKPATGTLVTTYARGTTPVDMNTAKAKTATPKVVIAGDLALIQGTWRLKSGHLNSPNETLTIQGDVLTTTAKVARGEARYVSHIKLDEAASPKAIDFLNPSAGSKKLPPAYGIYELDGDTLKIHKSGQGKSRASVFQDGAEQGSVSLWTRATSRRGMDREPAKSKTNRSATPKTDRAGPATYHSAKILSVVRYQMRVLVDGKEIRIGRINYTTKAFDIAGKPIADGQASRLIWEGNVVDLVTQDPFRGTENAEVLEVRLVEGKVGEQNPATGLQPR